MFTRLLIFTSILLFSFVAFSQTYIMGNGNISSCTGTFYDPGGTGNYGNNQNFTFTICNPTAGQPIYVNFTLFDTEATWDDLTIYNGASTAAPSLGTYSGTNSPGLVTGTSGCLTFVFDTDGSVVDVGWVASISCTPPPCAVTTNTLCGTQSQATSPNSSNQGTVGCLISTYNQTLYSIQPTTTGNITYTITSGCDVDFALWGPFASIPCGIPTTGTIDCSFSSSATEFADITNAVPGQYYILLVSNYCNVATNINLTPSGSASAGIACSTACSISATTPIGTILCNGGTTSITVNASGATSYTYSISPNPPGVTLGGNVFSNVPAGNYTITTTNATNAACTTTTSVTISQPSVLSAFSIITTPVACNGGTAVVTISGSGGTAPYAGTGNFNQAAGTQTYTITDANGCTATTTVTVTAPSALSASAIETTPIACNGGNAVVTISGSGGTAPYTGTGNFSQAAGTQTYTISDANGCTASTTITITEPTVLSASSVETTPIACNGGNAVVTISGSGGTAPYTGIGTTNQAAGTQTYSISDANGCTASTTITITEPTVLSASSIETTPIACNGGNAVIAVSGNGGTTPYTGTGNFSQAAGTQTYTISDANNCTATTTIAVTQPASPLSIANVQELCNLAGSTYTIAFDISGGTPPYSISGVAGTLVGTTFTSNAIAAGSTPTITITDNNLCGPITLIPVGSCTPSQSCNSVVGCFAASTIINGDFETFNPAAPFATFTSSYDYYDCDLGNSPCVNGGTGQNILCQYDFAVETGTPTCNNTWSANIADHTSGTGNMMLVDFPTGNVVPNNKIWCQDVTLLPNTDYCFGAYFLNLVPSGANYTNPVFEFQGNGIVLGTTIGIPEDEQWHFEGVQFNSAAGGLTNMCLANNNYGFLGYDLAIDDILLRQLSVGTPPDAVDDNVTFCDNIASLTIDVLSNDTGANIDPTTLQLVSYPAFGVGNAVVSNGQIIFTPNITTFTSTSFTYLVSNTSGCTDMATVTVTQVAHPQPTITGTTTFCQGQNPTLDAGAGYTTYSWTTPNGNFLSQTVSTGVAGQYIVQVTDANVCIGADTVMVTVNPLPTPTISTLSTSICQGDTATLDAGAGYNAYSWFQNNPVPSALGNAQTELVTAANEYGVTVTDANGCQGTDTITIIVNPLPIVAITQTPSNPVCPGTSATLDATLGFNGYSWYGTSTSVNGNTASLSVTATDTYNVAVTDANGCQNTANISTLFQDLVPPTIQNCPSNISQNNNLGVCGATVTWIAPTTSDNCSASIVQTGGLASGSVFPIGTSTVTYVATDPSGNTAICSFSITIADTELPVIANCPANIAQTNDAGVCGATVTWTLPTASDNCPNALISQTGGLANGSIFPIGTSTITYTATDASGNTATCSFTITVTDTEAPLVVNCPINIAQTNDAGVCGATVTWTQPTASDNCPNATITQTGGLASGSVFPIGTSTITYTATDASGNTATCTFTITVTDTELPIIANCPANIAQANDLGICGATVTWTQPTVSDNCPNATLTQTAGLTSGSVFPLGTSTVTYTATDASGNTATCSFTITITDSGLPVIANCPANIAVNNDIGVCGATVTWSSPTVTDNCSASIVQTGGLLSGSVFPIGTSTVSYLATDASGNTATCSFTITVTDTENPVIAACPSNIALSNDAGLCGAVVTWANPTATDNCPNATITQTSGLPNGAVFPIGTSTVVYTATDASGNTATCSFTVTVSDTEAPIVVNCPANIAQANDLGVCGATVTWTQPTASDNCPNATITQTAGLASGSVFPIGTSTVSYTATDANGNTATCSFNVTITDTELPVIANCPANITQNNDAGICGASVTWNAPTASDNCPNVTIIQTAGLTSGSVFPLGTSTITYTATDANGNTATCSFTITITDAQNPVIVNCPANITATTNTGVCTSTVTWPDPTATDNCSASIVQTSGLPSGSAFPIGISTIVYTATDASGNTATCSFTISVSDNLPPVFVNCPANIILNNDVNACGAIATWTAPLATDNCVANVVQSGGLASGSQFPIGTSTVTYTATDAAGNSTTCSFTVTVIDNQAPIIQSCPANITVSNDPNLCSAIVNWAAPTTSDNCAGAVITQTAGLVSGSTFPIGTTTISYTATDAAGNTAICSFTVTVSDTQVPVFASCPSNINANAGASCDAIISWNLPVATDNCNTVSVLQTQGPIPGSTFGLGTTTISYVATDAAGNTSTCSFTINVIDATAPVISGCPSNIALASDPGQCGAVATWSMPSATDNCGTANIVLTSTLVNGALFPIGTSTVVYTATDAAGNSSTCQFSVTVTDTEVPSIVGCPTNITLQATNGCSTIASWSAPTALDNCSGVLLTSSHNPGDVFGIGTNTVTYTATDANGNIAVCTFTITVMPPNPLNLTSTVNAVTCYGGANGSASVNVTGGSGNYTYSWTSIPVQTTATANGLPAGTYTVFVSDVNAPSCVQVANTIVTINQPQPIVATAVSLADANCNQNIGVAAVSVSGGSQNFTYSWNSVPPQTTAVASGLGLGTYTVTVTDVLNVNCTATASVTIIGTPIPSANVSPNSALSICEGTTTNLSVSGGNSYQWLLNGLPFQVGNNLTVTQAGNYQAIAFSGNNLNGCSDTSTVVNVSLNALPTAHIVAQTPTNVCEGQSVILSVLGNGTYTWLLDGLPTGESSQTITTTLAGSYTVVVANSCGTDTSSNIITQFNPLPVANFIILPAVATVQETTLFVDKSIDAATWSWSFGDGNGNATVQNPSYVYQEIGTYTVTLNITDAVGCAATASRLVRVEPQPEIFIPNTFTPNGDGAHDEFLVSANNVKQFVSFEIFDRWGNSVFITQDPTKGWNGNNKNGLACPSGTYYYIIDGIDYKERSVVHKGFLNLVR